MAGTQLTQARLHNRAAIDRVAARLRGYDEAHVADAARLATVSTRRKLEPLSKRVIRSQYGVRAGALSNKFRVQTGSDETGEFIALLASKKRIPLVEFGARWSGRARMKNGAWSRPATATVRVGERREYASAFIRTINGKKGVWVRQKNRATGKRDPRNKLRVLNGPSPFVMIGGADGQAEHIRREGLEIYAAEFRRQLIRLGGNR